MHAATPELDELLVERDALRQGFAAHGRTAAPYPGAVSTTSISSSSTHRISPPRA